MHSIRFALSIRIVAAFVVVVSAAPAGVIVVDAASGPGAQFTALQPAIDAATDGDTLLVRAGSYESATVDAKSLTLVGDGVVKVFSFQTHPMPFDVKNIAAGQRVVIRGMQFLGGTDGHGFNWGALAATNVAGTLWLDSCFFSGVALLSSLELQSCANVVMTHCDVHGGNALMWALGQSIHVQGASPALSSTASNVSSHRSTFVGGEGFDGFIIVGFGGPSSTPGAQAVQITGGSALFSACALTGGVGGDGYDLPGVYCISPAAGGSALTLETGNPIVQLVATALSAGATGAVAGACPPPAPAPVTLVGSGTLTTLAGDPGDFTATSPIRETQTETLATTSAVGSAVILLVSADPANQFLPQYAGALHVGGALIAIALGPVPAAGMLSIPIVVPSLPAGELGANVFAQCATCPAAAPCGLTAPVMIALLDSSL